MRKPQSDGVSASNQDYRDYDQVTKRQEYRFAEAEGAEAFDEETMIRSCDLGRWLQGDVQERSAFTSEFGRALEEIGFAILTGHGVDPALYEESERRVEAFFTGRSLDEKLRFRARRHGSVNQGYFPVKATSDIHPDLVEGWVFCRRAFLLGDAAAGSGTLCEFWPDSADEGFFRRLVHAHEPLILPVMQAVLAYLGTDPHLYDRRLTRTNFGLRLNYYPPVTDDDARSGAGRLLGHEDVDLFTFLPAPRTEGLQVLNRRNMKWIRLAAPPGSIIVNSGDYLQRITNDRLPSTTHRVSVPRDPERRRLPRVSFPMAIYVWEDEVLEVLPGLGPPKYEPVPAIVFHTKSTARHYGDGYAVNDHLGPSPEGGS